MSEVNQPLTKQITFSNIFKIRAAQLEMFNVQTSTNVARLIDPNFV